MEKSLWTWRTAYTPGVFFGMEIVFSFTGVWWRAEMGRAGYKRFFFELASTGWTRIASLIRFFMTNVFDIYTDCPSLGVHETHIAVFIEVGWNCCGAEPTGVPLYTAVAIRE